MSVTGWAGRARLRPGGLLYGGAVGSATAHAHHSVQVIAALDGDELVLAGPGGEPFRCRAYVVPAGVRHSVLGGVARGVVLHFDPLSSAGRRLTELAGDAGDLVPTVLPADPFEAACALDSVLPREPLAGGDPHPGLARVLAWLPGQDRVRLSQAAEVACLSESRLAHLFQAQLGLPFRPYVLWLRLMRAAELASRGHSLTDAAHGAGFADGAHLSRVWRRMFGMAPSDFTRTIRWM
ncbi:MULTISPECIES: AraC family transcriptional regulator [unclassified Streptomyces]|uniref:helix-turn-helix domain-containing protein n=1 Tax=unclassified Streptomyces TaxID=2593676 RepID=UPI00224ECB3A|nr:MULTISPECIES: helix-turn-helix domain-containing protein [unclassified Streptomyces]MCX4527984.1 helix-turn-helix domain-containing protein [Streptomyces sp. NBC_01551]MCX4541401.1 helix-turn-helix domain-containing protein [Streptomyces sp. NBC_01565]